MRILILGASGSHRTEAALARAAHSLGHEARVADLAGTVRRWGAVLGRLALQRALSWQPDQIVCTRRAARVRGDWRHLLFHGRQSALWYFDATPPATPELGELATAVNRVFATYGHLVTHFRRSGLEAAFLPQGMDPETDRPAQRIPDRFRCQLGFIGSGQYDRRHEPLRQFAAQFQLQIRGPGWDRVRRELPVAGGRIQGRQFTQAVGGAAVSLGIEAWPLTERQPDGGTSNRLWRVLGAGGCFLGEWVPGIEQMAQPGEHALWYRSLDEGLALARELLADPAQRQRLAAAGRAHALANHTYRHRLQLLLAGQGYTTT
jgi:hypothetical protein